MSPKHTRLLPRVAVAAILVAVLTHTRADPDLFGHVRFGHDMVAAGSVRLPDSYSFASDRPWVNHEWLAEIAMYLAYAAGGSLGLVALKLLLVAALLVPALRALRDPALTDSARDLLLALLVVGTFPQTNHVRPQLFSLALFAWLLDVLVQARASSARLLWCLPIFALWVNLHGGWIVGGAVLAAWTCASFLDGRPARSHAVSLVIGAGALATTLCNPYGWRMWSFLYETVGLGRADIVDWQPIFSAGPAYGLLWTLTAAAAAVGLWRSIGRKSAAAAPAIVMLLAVASLRVGRLLAFFTIATIVLLGPALAAIGSASAAREPRAVPRIAVATLLAAVLAVTLGAASLSARNLRCIRMEPELFPEPEVAAIVAQRGVRGRMLTWFDWGEYAIWYFAPDVSVSMDGRRETVYSDDAIQRQLRFYAVPDERQSVLDLLQPSYVWMPSRLTVTARLIGDGWRPLFVGPRSTLLASAAATIATESISVPPPSGPGAARCFPGP